MHLTHCIKVFFPASRKSTELLETNKFSFDRICRIIRIFLPFRKKGKNNLSLLKGANLRSRHKFNILRYQGGSFRIFSREGGLLFFLGLQEIDLKANRLTGPLKKAQFCSSSREAIILTAGTHSVFRGLKFELYPVESSCGGPRSGIPQGRRRNWAKVGIRQRSRKGVYKIPSPYPLISSLMSGIAFSLMTPAFKYILGRLQKGLKELTPPRRRRIEEPCRKLQGIFDRKDF